MELVSADPGTTLMVGDSQYDLQAARNAGVDSAGVAWSLKGPDFLKAIYPYIYALRYAGYHLDS